MVGVEEKVADDGWWLNALALEDSHVHGDPYSGPAVDVFRCFDQIRRDLLYETARRAGMPAKVLNAHMRFQESLTTRNSLGSGLGSPYTRRCGIPQGCSFSKMFTAMLIKPWISKMEQREVVPRVLADDLLITVRGDNHRSKLKKALDETHRFLDLLGAEVAPNKSAIFSSCGESARWLGEHEWNFLPTKGQRVNVFNPVRDLRAHISTGKWKYASTLRDRINSTIAIVHRIARLPVAFKDRAKLIRTRIFPKAFYGVEVSQAPEQSIDALNAAIANAITKKAGNRSPPLLCSFGSHGDDLDGHLNIALRRIATFKRMITKYPQTVMRSRRP